MGLIARSGLRARLALAFVAVALLAVGAATLVADLGLEPRVDDAARSRLQASAHHMAALAAQVHGENDGWGPATVSTLGHLAAIDGLRVTVIRPDGSTVAGLPAATGHIATAPVVTGGVPIGQLSVSQVDGQLLTPEERHLRHSLDQLHLVAAALSVAGALLVSFLLAQTLARPLRRIRSVARAIGEGDLSARVRLSGGAEVAAVGHALNRLAETLEHEERLRRESVGDLAHELRTPATGLLSRIEAAQDGVIPDAEANLAAMHAEALRLCRFLDDLSHLADAQRPGLLLEKQQLDLAEIVQVQVVALETTFAGAGLAVTTALAPAVVRGDGQRLGQVVVNLLTNAARYTGPGGAVAIRTGVAGTMAFVEVEDTGIGIAPDELPLVFTRFWRGEKSRSQATGGAGVGLAIADELARAHDGRIAVESRPGEGSRFTLLLPSAGEPAPGHRP